MTAYWLAYTFGLDPDVVLAKPPDEIHAHAHRTIAMMRKFKPTK